MHSEEESPELPVAPIESEAFGVNPFLASEADTELPVQVEMSDTNPFASSNTMPDPESVAQQLADCSLDNNNNDASCDTQTTTSADP
jgi:hypothetical protein